ncbi:MAG: DUF5666 domain-containing protein [Nitrospirae bacterium]|nr:DUF5666 domain-containing protein [Nitrospirota bacterium]
MVTTRSLKRRRRAGILTGIVVMAAAVFFVMSLGTQVAAAQNMLTLKGQVVAIDSYDKTLTVTPQPGQVFGAEGLSAVTFAVDKQTSVTWCEQNKSFDNLNVGQNVSVQYHREKGRLIADSISVQPVVLACYQ